MKRPIALAVLALVALALPALAQSPLEVVMDGREAAQTSNLTEAGMSALAQSTANVVMYVCGALAIALTALGLYEMYQASDADAGYGASAATKEGAMWKLVIAGLISIPAIIAAILPFALL
jgi:hypothetical protein